MNRRNKTDRLLNDIAVLVTKYGRDDWDPLLALLRDGTFQAKIADSIEASLQTARESKKKKAASPKQAAIAFSDRRAPILDSLLKAAREQSLLSDVRDIRQAFLKSGGKAALPKDRMAATKVLLLHLDALPDVEFLESLEELKKRSSTDNAVFADEYARWFELISKSRPS